jgi:soluble lytic murein transglycosylase-like protein
MTIRVAWSRALIAIALAAAAAGCSQTQAPSSFKNATALLTVRESPTKHGRGDYDALIARHAKENGVPLELAHAVVALESGYNPRATGRGTVGLMQIKPATARGIGYRGSTDSLYDADINLKWGMRYLGEAYRLGGGETCGTALRYQGGHGATRMSAASRAYCAKLKSKMARAS